MPSSMYGLYQITSARSAKNHAPHHVWSNASTRLTAGLAMSTSSGHDTPLQNSIAKKMPMKTMPVPRSGWSMMSSHGVPTTSAGFHSSSSDLGASFLSLRTRASM